MSIVDSVITTVILAILVSIGLITLAAIPIPEPNSVFHDLALDMRRDISQTWVIGFSLLGGFGFTIVALLSNLR
jgi:hypothetical protein